MPNWITQYWVQWAFGVVGSVLTGLFVWMRTRLRSTVALQKATTNGVKALLRDRIIQAYNHYVDKGECPIYALENVLALYKEYKALGGNGAIERLVNELKQLPTDKDHKEV